MNHHNSPKTQMNHPAQIGSGEDQPRKVRGLRKSQNKVSDRILIFQNMGRIITGRLRMGRNGVFIQMEGWNRNEM